jgi:hypothetical protein
VRKGHRRKGKDGSELSILPRPPEKDVGSTRAICERALGAARAHGEELLKENAWFVISGAAMGW